MTDWMSFEDLQDWISATIAEIFPYLLVAISILVALTLAMLLFQSKSHIGFPRLTFVRCFFAFLTAMAASFIAIILIFGNVLWPQFAAPITLLFVFTTVIGKLILDIDFVRSFIISFAITPICLFSQFEIFTFFLGVMIGDPGPIETPLSRIFPPTIVILSILIALILSAHFSLRLVEYLRIPNINFKKAFLLTMFITLATPILALTPFLTITGGYFFIMTLIHG